MNVETNMKSIIRNTAVNGLSLFILTQLPAGVKAQGGLMTFILGGLALSIMFKILKPILSIISLPINLLTLGLFSSVINILIFYLLTVLVSEISISSFIFPGASFAGFVVPRMEVNTFFAFLIVSVAQSFIVNTILWLTKK